LLLVPVCGHTASALGGAATPVYEQGLCRRACRQPGTRVTGAVMGTAYTAGPKRA